MTHVVEYTPHDTWFFRESRPHNAVGALELGSLFPPPVRTLAGALRTRIGDAAGTDWSTYGRDPNHRLRARIGYGTDPGPLGFTGAFVSYQDEPLYSAPANLLRAPNGELLRLALGAPTRCDLGHARLPTLNSKVEGAKPLENAWLTAAGFQAFLCGDTPAANTLVTAAQLYTEEPRLGIAMAARGRTAEDGMLYQTRHLRFVHGLSIRLGVTGLDEAARNALPAALRLGGEGRLAGVAILNCEIMPPACKNLENAKGLILTTLSPAQPGETPGLPPNFRREQFNGHHVWRGHMAGVALTIHGAACGKPLRLGGWNLAGAERGPVPVRSLLPPGTVWYCTPDDLPAPQAAAKLHNQTIDPNERWGQGLLACGLWPDSENSGDNK